MCVYRVTAVTGNNFTADRSQAHLLWMNVRLCLILKYILPWQTLYRGGRSLFRKLTFCKQTTSIRITNYFYPNNKLLLSE